MIATYTIELQRTREGWVWGIDQTVEEGPAAGIPSRYEDGDRAFPTAAEAAAEASRRLRHFQPSRTHLNTLIAAAGADITARARWLVRNNGYASNAIESWAGNVVGNPHEPLSDPARAAIQADVDALYGDLVGLVARNRNLTPEAVRGTEAAIYRGCAGVALGLADRIGTVETALAELKATRGHMTTTLAATMSRRSATQTRRVTMNHAVEPDDAPTAEPQDEPPQETREAASPESAPQDDAARTAAAEIAEVAAQAARLGVTVDAADAIRRGVAAHALRRSVLDTLAARAEASAVIAAAPKPGSSDESPIVRRARERAVAARS
jgi:hypothetical protein